MHLCLYFSLLFFCLCVVLCFFSCFFFAACFSFALWPPNSIRRDNDKLPPAASASASSSQRRVRMRSLTRCSTDATQRRWTSARRMHAAAAAATRTLVLPSSSLSAPAVSARWTTVKPPSHSRTRADRIRANSDASSSDAVRRTVLLLLAAGGVTVAAAATGGAAVQCAGADRSESAAVGTGGLPPAITMRSTKAGAPELVSQHAASQSAAPYGDELTGCMHSPRNGSAAQSLSLFFFVVVLSPDAGPAAHERVARRSLVPFIFACRRGGSDCGSLRAGRGQLPAQCSRPVRFVERRARAMPCITLTHELLWMSRCWLL